MRRNKYLGLVSGGVASLVIASAALASSIGPNTLTNQGPGWNSIAFQATSTTFGIRNCSASSSQLIFEVMRQWLFLPSTGTGQKTYTCSSSSSYVTRTWSNTVGDYKVEYSPWINAATISLIYLISY
jgi:hypothetical protein